MRRWRGEKGKERKRRRLTNENQKDSKGQNNIKEKRNKQKSTNTSYRDRKCLSSNAGNWAWGKETIESIVTYFLVSCFLRALSLIFLFLVAFFLQPSVRSSLRQFLGLSVSPWAQSEREHCLRKWESVENRRKLFQCHRMHKWLTWNE